MRHQITSIFIALDVLPQNEDQRNNGHSKNNEESCFRVVYINEKFPIFITPDLNFRH